MNNFKLSPCGMIVRLHRDKIHASDLSGRVYKRARGGKFVNLNGTPIRHNRVMNILAGVEGNG